MVSAVSKRFYVYLHKRSDDGEVFYIGKGQGRRAWSTKDRSKLWHQFHDEAGGYTIEIHSEWDDEWAAFLLERCLIKSYRLWHHPLANITHGGDGKAGIKRTEEQKEHLRKINTGKKHKPETIDKLKKRDDDPKWKEWHRQATIAGMDEEARARHAEKQKSQYKPVIGVNLETGEMLFLESSSQDKRFNSSSIRKCCLGKRKTHKGFAFFYP